MRIAVVGGGASGAMCAILLARGGADVFLIEKNSKIGKKIYITGKGRCNLTNDCSPEDYLDKVVNGAKFMRSCAYAFTSADTMAFFEDAGVALVTERGNRVFPLSQKSSDIIKALERELKKSGVDVKLDTEMKSVSVVGDGYEIKTSDGAFYADTVVVATGGLSYPSTGSTGDGYKVARSFGMDIVTPVPALCPIIVKENVSGLKGLSLKNVSLTAYGGSKELYGGFGEMMFTDKGITGPLALGASSYINRAQNVNLSIDLKPALDGETLDKRILSDFSERSNQEIKNVTRALLPERLNSYVLQAAGIPEYKKANSVTREERKRFADVIKNLKFTVRSLAPFSEAVITSGGINLKELKPTLEARKAKNLYFIGEVCDIDALTGGYNLQAAFSTAAKAARAILTSING